MKSVRQGISLRDCLFPAAVLAMILLLSSCTSTRQVHKREATIDSIAIQEKIDSIRLLRSEISTLEESLRQSQFAEVEFDTTPCPTIAIPNCENMLNKDTVLRLISELNLALIGANNQVKIHKDGTIEANGRVRSVSQSLETAYTKIDQQQKTIDSLAKALDKKETKVHKHEEEKDKTVKRTFLNHYVFWVLFFIAGYVVANRKQFFKPKIRS